MRLAALALCALPLAGCAAHSNLSPNLAPAPMGRADLTAAQRTSELPRTARPLHYAIDIAPDAAALRFSGRETIDLEVLEATRSITLNAHGLAIENVRATPATGGPAIGLA